MIMKRLLAYFSMVLLACGCGLDEPALSDAAGSAIEFSASKMRIITKAGDQAEPFAEGTDFRLFAVQSGTSWSADGVKFYNQTGTGLSTGAVDYSIDGKKASYDVGKTLDFYGLTYGTSSAVAVDGSAGSVPEVSLSTGSDGTFADLMYSDNLKSRNSSSGLLRMEFRHALSRLSFEVLKQDETGDNDKKLENVVLKKVVLKGSALSGVFNLNTGSWNYAASDVSDRPVYANSAGLKITTSAQVLKSGEEEISMLVIPNSGQLTLEVTVDLDGNPSTADDKVVDYDLTSSETERLALEPNHEYRLSIAVLKNDVRIVTVTPRVYEWIDVDLGSSDAYFGQPVYFGGLMWMDRNLGAKSADCENDWYNSIGYYYQFGRNIPYMLDVEAFVKTSQTQGLFTFTNGSKDTEQDAVFNLKYLFTYDDKGNKITTVKHANHSSGTCLYGNVAITPGDPGDYSFVRGYVYESGGKKYLDNRSWAKKDLDFVRVNDSKVVEGFDHHIFWETIENQPCPVGWRLPGKADMYSFMPESTNLYWTDSHASTDDMSKSYDTNGDGKITKDDNNHANYVAGNKNAAGEVYQWKYFAGLFKVDPAADRSASYSYPKTDTFPRVYGIKYEGEDKVYRVMFEQKSSRFSGRNFVRISRFASEPSDRFLISSDGTQWNIHKFDWSTPVEYMDIPLAGFIYEDGMSDFGKGTILRAKEGDGYGTNWTLYLRGDHNGVAVGGNSRRNLGENIRCVRDINAK